MKTFLLLLLSLFIVFNLNAQQKKIASIAISVEIIGLKDHDKYYLNGPSIMGLDSCIVQNGQIHFKYTGEPDQVSIGKTKDSGGVGDDLLVGFWTDKQDIKITGDKANRESMTISGSALWDNFIQLNKITQPIQDKRNEIVINSTYHNQDSVKSRLDSVAAVKKTVLLTYIQSNLHSYAGIILLYYSKIDKTFTTDEARGLLKQFDPELQNSKYGHLVQQLNKSYDQTKIGQMAPDFEQANQHGKPVRLSAFKGKYVLLEFSSSWCGPCRAMNPQLVKLYNKFKNKDFEIISVSTDVNRQTWLKTIKDDGLIWPQLSDLKGQQNEVATLYNINGIPHNFLIDKQGKIIEDNIYPDQLAEKLDTLLK
ncbi:redoxin domain-containing protein [Mucilaginibacter angelicae]|uniref:Redoxin domain-containing protein n=1 Tax=Mucilaginibacter angelicae TaxID=869718 RepID=A0ABV6L2M1_9SPHI